MSNCFYITCECGREIKIVVPESEEDSKYTKCECGYEFRHVSEDFVAAVKL